MWPTTKSQEGSQATQNTKSLQHVHVRMVVDDSKALCHVLFFKLLDYVDSVLHALMELPFEDQCHFWAPNRITFKL
jgi:hypothetical protein